ncbi:MAG TPA: helix-turn-helix domain-containing protein [Gemmatimonadaceae bacterium]|jgi:AraC-like DNA-binding protein|nr:helix-turn-helix domain-containing protein [Gemmatimonadaceae bacterium]
MPGPVQEIELEAAPGVWRLSRADPAPDVAEFVTEYWEVEGQLGAFREALLPNGRVELMLNLGPAHRVLSEQAPGTWERAWLSGLQERALVIESLAGTHLVAARLHPLGAFELLGSQVPGAANSVVDLTAVMGASAHALRNVAMAASGPGDRFALLEWLLRDRVATRTAAPEFVRHSTRRIEATHGSLRVSTLHDEVAVSRKHLAVSFTRAMGLSAKAYAQIQRFVWTLGRLQESTTIDWSKLASEAGYSDQSHLVRDFRRVGAATPTEYLRRSTPDGTALLSEPG